MELAFVKGLELSARLYDQAIKPLFSQHLPGLRYSAALIGPGSEVLGYDTPQSTDHDWGPRLLLFLEAGVSEAQTADISALLQRELPETLCGYPTRFSGRHDAALPTEVSGHRVEIHTVEAFFKKTLGFDPAGAIRAVDWLGVPEHRLLTLTAGRVLHDGLGQLERLREKLSYYPRDVWLYSGGSMATHSPGGSLPGALRPGG
jgi:hypothetical protein